MACCHRGRGQCLVAPARTKSAICSTIGSTRVSRAMRSAISFYPLEKMTGSFCRSRGARWRRAENWTARSRADQDFRMSSSALRALTASRSKVNSRSRTQKLRGIRTSGSSPKAEANPAANQKDLMPDMVIAPGNLYGSLTSARYRRCPVRATRETRATCVFARLVSKPGPTDGFGVIDFASEIERLAEANFSTMSSNTDEPSEELMKNTHTTGNSSSATISRSSKTTLPIPWRARARKGSLEWRSVERSDRRGAELHSA